MPRTFSKIVSVILSIVLIASCSPASEKKSPAESHSMPLPMNFDWQAPARLNVRETTKLDGKIFKVKYDLMVEEIDELEGHLLLSFENVMPIEFEGEQVIMSRYPNVATTKEFEVQWL